MLDNLPERRFESELLIPKTPLHLSSDFMFDHIIGFGFSFLFIA